MRRSNPAFNQAGLLRLQKAQARNDEADLCNNADIYALFRTSFFTQKSHCEERFMRRSNPAFNQAGLFRLQKAQARNDEADLHNNADIYL